MAERTTYPDTFKIGAAKRVLENNESRAAVAKDLDIHINVLRGFIKKYEAGELDPNKDTTEASTAPKTVRVGGASARTAILETLLAAHGINVPGSAEIEKGAKALQALDAEIDLEKARSMAATVLSAVGPAA